MATFQQSYKDIIRKLKKTMKEEDDIYDITKVPYFSSYLFELSCELEPIDTNYWFKKCFKKKHDYNLSLFKSSDCPNKQHNDFHELIGKNGWLSPITELPVITDDFMTGYYLAKSFIRDKKGRPILYFGAAKAQLMNGIVYEFRQHIGRLIWCGVDKKITKASKNYLVGITKSSDITNVNVIRSLRHNLKNKHLNKMGTFICDIYPHNIKILYSSLIFAMGDVADNGVSVIRLPDPHYWDEFSSLIINFIVFSVTHWSYVNIFKTPWGKKARYYVILNSPKEKFKDAKYTSMLKYISSLNEFDVKKYKLINEEYFKNKDVEKYITTLNYCQSQLINFHDRLPVEEANSIWLEQIMNIEHPNNNTQIAE